MSEYNEVFASLNSGNHVLLLIDISVFDFEEKVEDIFSWFSTTVKERYGSLDFFMKNNTWLCVRKLIAAPAWQGKQNMKVMVLR